MTVHEMMRTCWKKHEKQARVHVAADSIQGGGGGGGGVREEFSLNHVCCQMHPGNTGSVLEEVN